MGSGGSKSYTTTNIKTKLAVEALAENIMNCRSNTLVSQKFVLSGDYNVIKNSKQVQNFKLSTECSQDVKNIADLQQSVANAIKQAAESQSVSVLGALGESRAEVNLNIENEVKQKITQKTVLDIVNETNAQQEMIISGNHNIVDNFEQSQTLDLLFKNCQKVMNEFKSIQAIENSADQNSKATQSNFISDIVDSIFGGLASIGLIWMVVIVVAIAVAGYVITKGGPLAALLGSSGESSNSNNKSNSESNTQNQKEVY